MIGGMDADEMPSKTISTESYRMAANGRIGERKMPELWDLLKFPGSDYPSIVTKVNTIGGLVMFRNTDFPWKLHRWEWVNRYNIYRFRFLLWTGFHKIKE